MGLRELVFHFKLNDINACLYANKNNLAMKETLVMEYKQRINNHSRQEGTESRTQVERLSLDGHRDTFIVTRQKAEYVGTNMG